MIEIEIPGYEKFIFKKAFFDLNGTLSIDGIIKSSTYNLLKELSKKIEINIITADTLNVASTLFKNLNVNLIKLKNLNGGKEKAEIVEKNEPEHCVAFGNGYNDHLMLEKVKLGIIVLQEEGISIKSLLNADIIVKNIDDGIMLLLNEKRLIATLRR